MAFLNEHGPSRQFFPRYRTADFFNHEGLLKGLRLDDILLGFKGNRLIGTLALWDQQAFRQLVVDSYGLPLRWLRPLYNACAAAGGGTIAGGRPAISVHHRSLASRSRDAIVAFSMLLDAALAELLNRGTGPLLLGLHESDPLLPLVRTYRPRRYTTRLYLACWQDGEPKHDRSTLGHPIWNWAACNRLKE